MPAPAGRSRRSLAAQAPATESLHACPTARAPYIGKDSQTRRSARHSRGLTPVLRLNWRATALWSV